ncbi:hypothetical protein JDV02_002694 [Purpureocillium takamizusanense]|uniref:C2H2-type domain-containing protein n=1 Tax=Purpureocillium takamizusanense TaxID=2060973 RepID=A0A9Q8Q9X3_9HYPO|nr:uncharacterized protein JDV02_002694 [Purpureocillium takamizusanense]UNI16238.1 hypothetical protein JDV02_002694 [Purpureocillium takamizusanense]
MMDLTPPPLIPSPALSHQQKQQQQQPPAQQHQQPPSPHNRPQQAQQRQQHRPQVTSHYGMVQNRSSASSTAGYPSVALLDLDRGTSSTAQRLHLGRSSQALAPRTITEPQWEYPHQLPPVLDTGHDIFANYAIVQPQEPAAEAYHVHPTVGQDWASRHAGHNASDRTSNPVVHGNEFAYTSHDVGMLGVNPHDPSPGPAAHQTLTLPTCPPNDTTGTVLSSSVNPFPSQSPPSFVAQGWIRPSGSGLSQRAVLSVPATSASVVANTTRTRRVPRKHTTKDEANFQCTVEGCGKFFSRSYNYKSHLETHDEQREYPFPCLVSGCHKKFVRKTDLQRHHQSVHAKERNYRCDYCGRLFARKDTLRRHMEDGCSKRFDIKTLDLHSRGLSAPVPPAPRIEQENGGADGKGLLMPPTSPHTLPPEQPWRS